MPFAMDLKAGDELYPVIVRCLDFKTKPSLVSIKADLARPGGPRATYATDEPRSPGRKPYNASALTLREFSPYPAPDG